MPTRVQPILSIRPPSQRLMLSIGGTGPGPDFGKLVAESIGEVVEVGRVADQKSIDLVDGKANVVDVVTAISETEIALQTMVTIRDRVISAYEEIMRMPI